MTITFKELPVGLFFTLNGVKYFKSLPNKARTGPEGAPYFVDFKEDTLIDTSIQTYSLRHSVI